MDICGEIFPGINRSQSAKRGIFALVVFELRRNIHEIIFTCHLGSARCCFCNAYAYTPGTYTAAIAGQNGPVKVEVTTSADKILSVKIIDQKETEGIGSKAVAALPSEIVKAQSADVQGIAGASVSSAAIKKAVQECLNQLRARRLLRLL